MKSKWYVYEKLKTKESDCSIDEIREIEKMSPEEVKEGVIEFLYVESKKANI